MRRLADPAVYRRDTSRLQCDAVVFVCDDQLVAACGPTTGEDALNLNQLRGGDGKGDGKGKLCVCVVRLGQLK